MFKSVLLSLGLLSSLATNVHAKSPFFQNDPSLEITSVTVYEVENLAPMLELPSPTPNVAIGDIITAIDGMLAVGQKIWKIVDASRPVVTTNFSPSISVLPDLSGVNPALNQMAHWSRPISRSFRVSLRNASNTELLGFTYSIYFQFNGSYKGKGKYIANLKVDASDIYASWFYNFDATSELVGVANVGTDEEPVASAIMKISYAIKKFGTDVRKVTRFYVDGLGNIQVIQ